MQLAPLYNVHSWKLKSPNPYVMRLRPGPMVFLRRLQWTFLCCVIAGLIHVSFRQVDQAVAQQRDGGQAARAMEEAVRGLAGGATSDEAFEQQMDRKLAEIDAARESARAERSQMFSKIRTGQLILEGVLVGIGLVIPLNTLWSRMNIFVDKSGALRVHTLGWRLRKASWPVAEFDGIGVTARERIIRHRHHTDHGWYWVVALNRKGAPAPGLAMTAAVTSEPIGPQFMLLKTKHHPGPMRTMPTEVREFAEALHAMTRLPVSEPAVFEEEAVGSWSGRREVRQLNPAVTRQTVSQQSGRLDDLTPEQRRDMLANVKVPIRIQDKDGNIRTYDSVEDLPPEIRAHFE